MNGKNNMGESIAHFRESHGLSQEELANALFVTQQTVSKWENGRAVPQCDRLEEIADRLDEPVGSVLYGDGLDPANGRCLSLDMTSDMEAEIAELEEKCSEPGHSKGDEIALMLERDILAADSPNTGGPGRFEYHFLLTESEYDTWKALKKINPRISERDFAEMVQDGLSARFHGNNH